ncbi:MAG: helix-hairpin-helix domain-containing protein, partial [Flavobacteriaceae bacterium]|nr:helix-hairpin-helix domain-containing protein [Flavobacteriaceae bacterium]
NIKSVVGPDDFASMEEVVHRRYRRMLDEDEALPQLIIIDGGKGQLNAALKSLKSLGLENSIAIVGIAKKLEELFFPDDPYPLHLDKRSDTLKIIQQLRNEAHRFGIKHHRNKRSKNALHTELDAIRGIGEKTSVDLLKHFKTVKKIKTADLTALSQVVGKAKAQLIYEYFHEKAST